jgi:predicted nucleic acid-binding protein
MFWDSSALVPLLLPDVRSAGLSTLLRSDAEPALWWVSPVECQSALYRRHREGALSTAVLTRTLQRLKTLVADVDVVAPTPRLRERAGRLLAGHPLRAGDALQLAAALIWCDESPEEDTFVCLDERLAEAAHREGFTVVPD